MIQMAASSRGHPPIHSFGSGAPPRQNPYSPATLTNSPYVGSPSVLNATRSARPTAAALPKCTEAAGISQYRARDEAGHEPAERAAHAVPVAPRRLHGGHRDERCAGDEHEVDREGGHEREQQPDSERRRKRSSARPPGDRAQQRQDGVPEHDVDLAVHHPLVDEGVDRVQRRGGGDAAGAIRQQPLEADQRERGDDDQREEVEHGPPDHAEQPGERDVDRRSAREPGREAEDGPRKRRVRPDRVVAVVEQPDVVAADEGQHDGEGAADDERPARDGPGAHRPMMLACRPAAVPSPAGTPRRVSAAGPSGAPAVDCGPWDSWTGGVPS